MNQSVALLRAALFGFLLHCVPSVFAGPLQQAQVHRIVNDVRIVQPQAGTARPAQLQDVIKDDLAVRTGTQSRAELLFQDNTLTRLGADSLFSFKTGTREMSLDRGTMLLQVPKGLGGAKIRTAAVTAAITGTTIMIEYVPGSHVKVLVLEGSLRLSLNKRLGESVILNPGRMIILSEKETRMPKPVSVDLAKVVKTSALVDPEQFRGKSKTAVDPLPSMSLIEKEMATQALEKGKAHLTETNLLIQGDGTNVLIASKETMSALDATPQKGGDSAAPLAMDKNSKRVGITEPTKTSAIENPLPTQSKSKSGDAGNLVAATAPLTPPPADPDAIVVTDAALPGPVQTPPPNTNPIPTTVPSTISAGVPYVIGAGTVIDTTKTDPSITTGGVTIDSLFFKSNTTSGSASQFLFGTTSLFDGQMNLDQHYQDKFSNSGVYKFHDLEIDGNPIFLTKDGANRVAWISETDINSSSTPGQVTLDGVKRLFLGTVNGSINLTDKVAFAKTDGTAFNYLELYARNGDVNFGAPVTLKDAELDITAEHNVAITPTAVIWTKVASVTGLGNVAMDGSITSEFTQLYAGAALNITGSVTGKHFFTFGNTGVLGGSLILDDATLEFASDLTLGSTSTFVGKKFTATSGADLVLAGSVIGNELNFTAGNAFTAQVGSTLKALTDPGTVTVDSGGAITLAGQTMAKRITLTAGTDTNLVGAITLSGPVQSTDKFIATGSTITLAGPLLAKDLTLTGSAAVNLPLGGTITSTGKAILSSDTLVRLNGAGTFNELQLGGNASVEFNSATQAQKVTTVSGSTVRDITITGPLTVAGELKVDHTGNFTVAAGASVTAPSAGKFNVTTTKNITFAGQVTAKDMTLQAGGDLAVSAPITSTGNFSATSRDATIGTTLTANQTNFTLSRDFSLATGVSMTTTKDTSITSSAGSITIDGSTVSEKFLLSAKNNISVAGTVQATEAQLSGGSALATNVTVTGQVTAGKITSDLKNLLTLDSGGVLLSTGDIALTAPKMVLAGSTQGGTVTLTAPSTLTVDGGIQAKDLTVTGGTAIFSSNVTAINGVDMSYTSNFTQGTSSGFTAGKDIAISSYQNMAVSGAMSAVNVNLSSLGNATVNATSTVTGAASIDISGDQTIIKGSLDAPTVTLSGTTSLKIDQNTGYVSAATVKLSSSNGIVTVGASGVGQGGIDLARLTNLQASGKGVVIDDDLATSSGKSTLTAGATGIDATGKSLSGFKTVSVDTGDYVGKDLSSDTVNITNNGSLTLSGDFTSTGKADVSQSIDVNGTITAKDISAGNSITADTLSVGKLDAPKLTVGAGGITRYVDGNSVINAPIIKTAFGIFMTGTTGTPTKAPGAGGSLDLTTDALDIDATGNGANIANNASFEGGDADPARTDEGGNGGTFKLTTTGDVNVNSPITADTGLNSTTGMFGGKGGTVELNSSGTISVNSKIKVSSTETSSDPTENTPRRASKDGGNIKLVSKATTGTAIAINNSAELVSLLDAASPGKGGKIEFESEGGAISVVGGKIKADRGTVDIRNKGLAGTVTLTNANIRGDVVKVGALGANGQLIVGGGTISADTMLKLYGGSSGGLVRFTNNVNLSGAGAKIIAGKTVTIDNGRTVNVTGSGPATVYTDTANYTGSGGNNSTTGKFGGSGATTQALTNALGGNNAPSF